MKKDLIAPLVAGLALATSVHAQDLLKDALASFPKNTVRVEYSRPAKLRSLPNYAALRHRYVGPRLEALETSLAKLGVRENDVDELVMGWQFGGQAVDFYGLATGRFDPKLIAETAANHGVNAVPIGGRQAYCLGTGEAATCVAVMAPSRGAFGSVASLTALEGAQANNGVALGTDERFMNYLKGAQTDVPIWGVAVGPAVADWFKGWMPGQENLQMDWSHAFGGVEALSYSVQVGDKVQLNVNLDCPSREAAANLRQLLEGVKMFQQIAWQNRNPNQPNPFQGLTLAAQGNRVKLDLSTSFAELESVGTLGTP